MSLEQILEKVAKSQKIQECKYNKEVNVAHEGFMGNVSKIRLTGKNTDGEETRLELVIKTSIKNEVARKRCLTRDLFLREIFMYSTVFPFIQAFLRERNFKTPLFVPASYGNSVIDMDEIVVLRDLTQDGYQLYDKRKAMDKEHVEMVVKNYGILHAISLAIQDQKPNEYQQLKMVLDNIYLKQIKSANLGAILHTYSLVAMECLKEEKYIKRYESFIKNVAQYFENCVEEEVEYSVILHGDCWTNNFMFAYDNGTLKEMRFLDFQFSRIGNPTLDLSFFFYCCAPENILANVEDYIKLYHETLSTTLDKLGSNPNIFPYDKLMAYWRKYASYGLALCALSFFLCLADTKDLHDMNNISQEDFEYEEQFKKDFGNKSMYWDRMRINIKQCVDKNYI